MFMERGPSYYTKLVIDTVIGVGNGPFGPATFSCRIEGCDTRSAWCESVALFTHFCMFRFGNPALFQAYV